jgi:hypothetical protein
VGTHQIPMEYHREKLKDIKNWQGFELGPGSRAILK